MAETKLLFSYNIIINELSSVPLLHGVLFLHWTVGRTEGLWRRLPVSLCSHVHPMAGFSPHFAIKANASLSCVCSLLTLFFAGYVCVAFACVRVCACVSCPSCCRC